MFISNISSNDLILQHIVNMLLKPLMMMIKKIIKEGDESKNEFILMALGK